MVNELSHLSFGWLDKCSKYQPLPCNLLWSFVACVLELRSECVSSALRITRPSRFATFGFAFCILFGRVILDSWHLSCVSRRHAVLSMSASCFQFGFLLRSGCVLIAFWLRFKAWYEPVLSVPRFFQDCYPCPQHSESTIGNHNPAFPLPLPNTTRPQASNCHFWWCVCCFQYAWLQPIVIRMRASESLNAFLLIGMVDLAVRFGHAPHLSCLLRFISGYQSSELRFIFAF